MKMNKKGFTLIEMLVVIAIIAVLVSIIIPVVGNSTVKASAATNAANLRSYKAAVTTAYLADAKGFTFADADDESGVVTIANTVKIMSAPEPKKMEGVADTAAIAIERDGDTGEFIVTMGGYTIADFAAVADGEFNTVAEAKADRTEE